MAESVLRRAAADMLNWRNHAGLDCGMGVMEMSHRGPAFAEILQRAQDHLRTLLAIPECFHILFMQGGGLAENAIVPLNLVARKPQLQIDCIVTGAWSQKTFVEAQRYGNAHCVADTGTAEHSAERYRSLPDPASWQLRPGSSYVHVCGNETIHGVEFASLPDLALLGSDAPLVVDASSHILSRPIAWERVGLVYAGAQKNIGPAGLTVVIVRDDLLGAAHPHCPSAFNYQKIAAHHSMYNTPPTWGIYMAGLVFEWLLAQGGLAVIEAANQAKAKLLYSTIDSLPLFENRVHANARSRMNVPFFLRDNRLESLFLQATARAGLVQLKGHKSVGGLRASIYNAMPLAGVSALCEVMRAFAQQYG